MSFDDQHGALERRRIDPTIEMIAHKVVNMERSLDKLTEAITKLAVIEEKQTTDRAALERAFMAIQKSDERCTMMCDKIIEKLEKLEARTDTLETAAPSLQKTNHWVENAMWAAASFAVYVVVSKLGLVG
jgi:prefoldin subunit 5